MSVCNPQTHKAVLYLRQKMCLLYVFLFLPSVWQCVATSTTFTRWIDTNIKKNVESSDCGKERFCFVEVSLCNAVRLCYKFKLNKHLLNWLDLSCYSIHISMLSADKHCKCVPDEQQSSCV